MDELKKLFDEISIDYKHGILLVLIFGIVIITCIFWCVCACKKSRQSLYKSFMEKQQNEEVE
jgi:hypothetical protein